jgi:hypothetical protein
MAMKRIVRGAENNAAIEHGQYLANAPVHIAVPQFEVAAILFSPVLVQIEKDVEAPVQTELLVSIEVGVHLEVSASLNPMQPPALEVGVGDEAVNTRQGLENTDEA